MKTYLPVHFYIINLVLTEESLSIHLLTQWSQLEHSSTYLLKTAWAFILLLHVLIEDRQNIFYLHIENSMSIYPLTLWKQPEQQPLSCLSTGHSRHSPTEPVPPYGPPWSSSCWTRRHTPQTPEAMPPPSSLLLKQCVHYIDEYIVMYSLDLQTKSIKLLPILIPSFERLKWKSLGFHKKHHTPCKIRILQIGWTIIHLDWQQSQTLLLSIHNILI